MRLFNRIRSTGGSGRLRNAGVSAVDHLAPTVLSTTVAANGTTVTMAFSEVVFGDGGFGFEISQNGSGAPFNGLTYVSGTGTTTYVFTTADPILFSNTPSLYYSFGNIEDAAGNDLGIIFQGPVTNNSEL